MNSTADNGNEMQFFGLGYGNCRYCESRLDVHRQLCGYCGSAACQLQAAIEADAAKTAERKARLLASVAELRESLTGGEETRTVATVITPSNDQRLTALSKDRLTAFSQHLSGLFSAVLDDNDIAGESVDAPPVTTAQPTDPLFSKACAHCRGQCCQHGNAAQAFLSKETIRDRLAQLGVDHHGELLDRYLRLIPEYSFENSCIYHAADGCALPRELRSDVCNGFYCEHLRDIDQERVSSSAKLLLVAEKNYRPVRSELIATDW